MKILIVCLLLVNTIFSKDTLNVAVASFEPLVIKKGDNYEGFDIDLWNAVAKELDVHTNFVYMNEFSSIFNAFENNVADVAISGITINHSREQKFDFTHPYKGSGLAIMVKNEGNTDILASLKQLFTGSFLNVWVFFLGFILVVAHIIWLTEKGSEAFDDKYSTGIWQSLWWTFVTVTTVGYGDKVPGKPLSKVMAVLVMMVGIGVAGVAIAGITSITQMEVLKYSVNSKEDLSGKKVATIEGTTSEKFLNDNGAYVIASKNVENAILQLEANKVSAVVFDAPVLKYMAKNNPNVITLDQVFDKQDYGILLPDENNGLREKITQAVLLLIKNGKRDEIETKWFGK